VKNKQPIGCDSQLAACGIVRENVPAKMFRGEEMSEELSGANFPEKYPENLSGGFSTEEFVRRNVPS